MHCNQTKSHHFFAEGKGGVHAQKLKFQIVVFSVK